MVLLEMEINSYRLKTNKNEGNAKAKRTVGNERGRQAEGNIRSRQKLVQSSHNFLISQAIYNKFICVL